MKETEKIILESVELQLRILAKVARNQISEEEIQQLNTILNKLEQLVDVVDERVVDERGLESEEKESTSIEVEVTKYLNNFCIPKSIKGYRYLRYAIILRFQKGDKMHSITKELYPAVADNFHTTPGRVERAIRHAIEVSWESGYFEKQHDLFGHSVKKNKKPTNTEFIDTIVDDMRLKRL